MIQYHDTEWGVPVHDDGKLFEFLTLDAFQAGLSWEIILKKRENFRKVLDNFDPEKISRYTAGKVEKLMQDAGIVRNRLKIESTVSNAAAFLKVQRSLEAYGTDNPSSSAISGIDNCLSGPCLASSNRHRSPYSSVALILIILDYPIPYYHNLYA